MDISSLLQSILFFSIGTTSVSAVVVFISKTIFNNWMDMKVIKYENEFNLKLEEFKIEKQKIVEKNRIRYIKLHEDRAEVIKNLYSELVDMQDYLSIYVGTIKSREINNKEFEYIKDNLLQGISSFMNYTNRNRIFFDDNILFNIQEIEAITMIIVNSYENHYDDNSDFSNSENWNELVKSMVKDEIPKFRKDLEMLFRELLGSDKD